METLDQFKNLWKENSSTPALTSQEMDAAIKSRINKEKKNIAEYFWLSLAFQILIYSFASFMIAKYWSEPQISIPAVLIMIVYIPFTVIIMRKFKAMFAQKADKSTDIATNVSNQHEQLKQIFRFKKAYDYLSITINSLVLVVVLFTLYVPGGVSNNLYLAVLSFVILLLVYAIAAYFENQKHFIRPLRQFEEILKDVNQDRQTADGSRKFT